MLCAEPDYRFSKCYRRTTHFGFIFFWNCRFEKYSNFFNNVNWTLQDRWEANFWMKKIQVGPEAWNPAAGHEKARHLTAANRKSHIKFPRRYNTFCQETFHEKKACYLFGFWTKILTKSDFFQLEIMTSQLFQINGAKFQQNHKTSFVHPTTIHP